MLSYENAGVSIEQGNKLVKSIKTMTQDMRKVEGANAVGGFAAIAGFPKGYKNPQMVLATDGVGTKLLLCKQTQNFKGIGEDLVAMSVNDILTLGAEPYLFLDYYATSKLEINQAKAVLKSIVRGCKKANVALVGGETAEMPDVYAPGDFDLAGFCVGVLEKGKAITGQGIRPGDCVVGLPSQGVHANGFSLVRKILKTSGIALDQKVPGTQQTWGKVLMRPTKIYVPEVLPVLKKRKVSGMSHITGGGLKENMERILPDQTRVVLDASTWRIHPVFLQLARQGEVPTREMIRTFNLGIGYVMVAPEKEAKKIQKTIKGARLIGHVERHNKQTPCVDIENIKL